MKIRKASDQPIVRKMGGYQRFVEKLVMDRWGTRVNWTILARSVTAEIVRSNWVVRCPFCAGSQVVDLGEPFYCVDCCMQANAGLPMEIFVPTERREIERLLLMRPDPNTRNWLFGETVENLQAENLEHGLEV